LQAFSEVESTAVTISNKAQPSTLENLMFQDAQLQQDVLAELAWEPSVIAAHIGVAAKSGVVTLTGHVSSFAEKHAAEAAARRVRGVKALAEELEVRLPFEARRGDEEIAAAAIERLAWDALVPAAIKITVEDGWIRLTGEVDWFYQKDAAEQDVCRLVGVTKVVNEITVKPRVDVSAVSDDIMHALHRSWFFNPKTIRVSANGGKVRLSGTVCSSYEHQSAAVTAWSAPGVTEVENAITIV
jgi:osmotically-inducible protein OsmY